MDAQEILKKVSEKYANCRTYSDVGSVKSYFRDNIWHSSQFRTLFERQSRFRFEWQDVHLLLGSNGLFSIVWSNFNKTTLKQVPVNGDALVYEKFSVLQAVGFATGGSLGAARMIPTIMLDEIRLIPRQNLLDFVSVVSLGQDYFGGITCCVIKGIVDYGACFYLWVDEEHTIHRIVFHETPPTWAAHEVDAHFLSVQNFSDALSRNKDDDGARFAEYRYEQVSFDLLQSGNR